MASHVVVIDPTARRAVIKVSPGKHLSDVLEEACSKLGATSSQYGLKHNNKVVDLSRTFRLSGLSSGAKLELVQLSRSASVVSVALQLPESEGNTRLTEKFPSTTTLWLVLRKFEAGVAGDGGTTKYNLTARGAPGMTDGTSGAGRLYYQTPVIQVMGRELSSFMDLQKTLAQLGFNSGSTLLRLSFRTSETPLEEAMVEIGEYFQSVDGAEQGKGETQNNETLPEAPPEAIDQIPTTLKEATPPSAEFTIESPSTEPSMTPSQPTPSQQQPHPPATATGRPIQIFSPPTSSTPSAALTTHNPADYIPSIEHAKAHQRHLQSRSRNTRLLSESELAQQSAAQAEQLTTITAVEIKIRFPDQSAAVSSFGQADTGATLYGFVRDDCLDERWRNEKFVLSYSSAGSRGGWENVPDDEGMRLIKHLGLKGRVLLQFKWDEGGGASREAMTTKDVLKRERREEARVLKVPDVPEIEEEEEKDTEEGAKVDVGKKEDEGGEKKRKGVPKWLKLPGKK